MESFLYFLAGLFVGLILILGGRSTYQVGRSARKRWDEEDRQLAMALRKRREENK